MFRFLVDVHNQMRSFRENQEHWIFRIRVVALYQVGNFRYELIRTGDLRLIIIVTYFQDTSSTDVSVHSNVLNRYVLIVDDVLIK
jgi:hypothetical protein